MKKFRINYRVFPWVKISKYHKYVAWHSLLNMVNIHDVLYKQTAEQSEKCCGLFRRFYLKNSFPSQTLFFLFFIFFFYLSLLTESFICSLDSFSDVLSDKIGILSQFLFPEVNIPVILNINKTDITRIIETRFSKL